jgi:cytochrome P450
VDSITTKKMSQHQLSETENFVYFYSEKFYLLNQIPSLLTLEGQEWRDRRIKFTPIFTSGKMKMMFDIVNLIGDRLVSAVEKSYVDSNVLDMRTFSAKFTCDVIGNVAFGFECRCKNYFR